VAAHRTSCSCASGPSTSVCGEGISCKVDACAFVRTYVRVHVLLYMFGVGLCIRP
jgi:hypothetical protein